MASATSGKITVVFDADHKAKHPILVGGGDLRLIVQQLTSAPLVGRSVALPKAVYDLANEVFDAIADFNGRGLPQFLTVSTADRFFECFHPFWRSLSSLGFQLAASELWARLLQWTIDWESKHAVKIHKGTPFFWLGESLIYQGDIDTAFLFIYNAMEQDKSWSQAVGQPDEYKQSPAYKTATINDSKENTLYETVVRPVRDLISGYATGFSKSIGSAFSLNDFQANFLDRPDLEKVVFFFVYNMYNHVHRNRFKQAPHFFENDFSKLRNLDSIFNMCLVIEEVLQYRYAGTQTNYYISDGVLDHAAAKAWIPTGKTREETEKQFFSKLVGVDLRLDPFTTVPVILSGNITYDGQPLRPELRYLLLAWHLRNYGGHNVRAQDVLVRSYDRIFEWLMFALLVSENPR